MLSSFLLRQVQRSLVYEPHPQCIDGPHASSLSKRPGAISFTITAKFALRTVPSRRPHPLDHLPKLKQILPTEGTPASSNGYEWLWRNRIRPTRWQRAQRALSIVKVDAVLAPVMAIHDQFILLVEQRMKWVGHPERWS
jgi:hypothetical protein